MTVDYKSPQIATNKFFCGSTNRLFVVFVEQSTNKVVWSSPFIGCILVTMFGYFITLDWMTHHPELHSSIHPQLVHLQKHNNVCTKILLIINAEWMPCMFFPFWGFSPTYQYSRIILQWLWAEAVIAKGKIHFLDFTFGQAQIGALIVGLNVGFDWQESLSLLWNSLSQPLQSNPKR